MVVGAEELDFHFTIIQTLVGYQRFDKGISKLKQVMGRDHRAVQRYIIGAVAGSIPWKFLMALRTLLDFRYLAQAPVFTTHSLKQLTNALQEFHENKDAIVWSGARDGWQILKLELLQSVVPGIQQSGLAMQWTANITEHVHVEEIKVLARAGNNQNYYSQITHHLNRLNKCFHFDLATYIEEHRHGDQAVDEDFADDHEDDKEYELNAEKLSFAEYSMLRRYPVDYFSTSSTLLQGSTPLLSSLSAHSPLQLPLSTLQ